MWLSAGLFKNYPSDVYEIDTWNGKLALYCVANHKNEAGIQLLESGLLSPSDFLVLLTLLVNYVLCMTTSMQLMQSMEDNVTFVNFVVKNSMIYISVFINRHSLNIETRMYYTFKF